jgi:hypothetical protein
VEHCTRWRRCLALDKMPVNVCSSLLSCLQCRAVSVCVGLVKALTMPAVWVRVQLACLPGGGCCVLVSLVSCLLAVAVSVRRWCTLLRFRPGALCVRPSGSVSPCRLRGLASSCPCRAGVRVRSSVRAPSCTPCGYALAHLYTRPCVSCTLVSVHAPVCAHPPLCARGPYGGGVTLPFRCKCSI